MPWKLYIDSRKRVKGARGDSDSSFAIQLPYPITVSGKCYIDVVLLSNNFYTIRANDNDRIYLDEMAAQTKRVVTIAPGRYTIFELRDALVAALNNARGTTGQYAIVYLQTVDRFQISLVNSVAADQFRIWSEAYMETHWEEWSGVTSLSANNLGSANRPCGFSSGGLIAGADTVVTTAPNAPDVQPYNQLFIRSSLASNESLGVNGESDIVRRIVIGNTPQGSVVHDVHSQIFDCITIAGKPEISQMWFELIDIHGKIVDTHGLPVSFSVFFQDVDE